MNDANTGVWHAVRRTPLLWAMPVVVALLALILMPVNQYLGGVPVLEWNGDPQGDDFYDLQYDRMTMRFTSGLLVGTLLAVLFGAALVTRMQELSAGRAGIVRCLAWAFVGGAVLAVVDVATAYLAAGPTHTSRNWLGEVHEVDLFQPDGPWRIVVVWAAVLPVASLAGGLMATLWTRPLRTRR